MSADPAVRNPSLKPTLVPPAPPILGAMDDERDFIKVGGPEWDDDWHWGNGWPPREARLVEGPNIDLLAEVLRRAVDIRETAAEEGVGHDIVARGTFTVALLNELFQRQLRADLPDGVDPGMYRGPAWHVVAAFRRDGYL